MKNFLSTLDLGKNQLNSLLDDAQRLKQGKAAGTLAGKTMGMVFFNSSLRTRTSFEAGMFQLGGHALNLAVGGDLWDLETADGVVMDGARAEHVKEAVPVLSSYVDVLGVRAFAQGADYAFDRTDPVLSAFASYSEVPVINMESGLWHPCQALADALTWNQAGIRPGDDIALVWCRHPKPLPMAVPNSVMMMAAQMRLNISVIRPAPFALDPELCAMASEEAEKNGGSVTHTDDVNALAGAKVVYAKSWGSIEAYGNAQQHAAFTNDFSSWQVTGDLMQKTDNAVFMHCLPVRRNVVVSDEVLDSEYSMVVQQAENRLHVQKALLLKLIGNKQ